jgi:PAS domain S-box-containing protein
MCRIFAATPTQMTSLTIFDLVPGYTPETWKERWQQLASEGSQSIELVARDGQGRRFPVEVSSSYLVYNGKGRVCSFVRDISERKRAEEQIQHTVSILSATLESIADGIVVLDLQKNVVMYNKKYPQMMGIPEAVITGGDYRSMLDLVLAELREPERFRELLAASMGHPEQETVIVMEFNDGRIIERVSCPYLVGGQVAGIVLNMRDVTLQRRVEVHLRNAQKVEALGTLTGGIAHDFNNRLTAIIGYGSLIRSQPGISDLVREYVDLLLVSAKRSAELTQGLLAYSRKQTLNPVPLALNDMVRDLEKFFPPIIGEHISLCIELSKESPVVRADRGQMEQVLFNLVGNARDAMDGVGRLTIATGAAFLDADFVAAQGYGESGDYAILSVTDTGAGIDAATLEKIFEPFFTTKEVGKGTGLGLSIVYGIVKQHEGFINVLSEPGLGTTFWLYLPLAREMAPEIPRREPSVRAGRGETILLVEDDQEVRSLFREVLEHHGYQVIEAVDGTDGVMKFRERGAFIDLLVIDVIMPRKNGWEAFNEITKLRSDVKAIFVSGYTYDIVSKAGLADKGLHFMAKPVSPVMLLQKLRELLD